MTLAKVAPEDTEDSNQGDSLSKGSAAEGSGHPINCPDLGAEKMVDRLPPLLSPSKLDSPSVGALKNELSAATARLSFLEERIIALETQASSVPAGNGAPPAAFAQNSDEIDGLKDEMIGEEEMVSVSLELNMWDSICVIGTDQIGIVSSVYLVLLLAVNIFCQELVVHAAVW